MSKKGVPWPHGELPDLVAKGVLTAPRTEPEPATLALVGLGGLGLLLRGRRR